MIHLLRGYTLILDREGLTETAPLPGAFIENVILIGLTQIELRKDYRTQWLMLRHHTNPLTNWVELPKPESKPEPKTHTIHARVERLLDEVPGMAFAMDRSPETKFITRHELQEYVKWRVCDYTEAALVEMLELHGIPRAPKTTEPVPPQPRKTKSFLSWLKPY